MTSSAPSLQEQAPAPPAVSQAAEAEAARYALLRRLAPSMRHHLVVNLQPIGMIYEVMDRRLRAAEPDLAEVHEGAHKINGFARAALSSCLDVVTWLAPEEDARTTAADGVRECLGLLATSLTFRGYALRNGVTPVPGEVRRSAIRNVLSAALIHVTDENPPPAEMVLAAEPDRSGLVLTLTLRPTDGDKGFSPEPAYRPIEWADVQALAAAESVTLSRTGRQQMRLSIPWASAHPA
ncbi:MAG: hypothetical protein JWQ07_1893 [Ramlibacter sp.]|nr:hypothetical protein [Ramlibacter sp.]